MLEKPADESNIKVDIETQRWYIVGTVHAFLDKYNKENSEELKDIFKNKYNELIKYHEEEDTTDIKRFYRLISEFRHALEVIIEPGQIFDNMCDRMAEMFDLTLAGIQRKVDNKIRRPSEDGPVMPGSDKTTTIKFFCTVCKEFQDIPKDLKEELLNSDETIELPKHHDKELEIRIVNVTEDSFEIKSEKADFKVTTARELMGYSKEELEKLDKNKKRMAEMFPSIISQANDDIGEYLNILSVGIDVGSSTSHLIFSGLTLRREQSFMNMSNRFHLVGRKIFYEGNIIDTPLIDRFTIDIDAVVNFFEEEYEKAGITPEMVDTGAVIVTGETAKKQNAEEIVRRLSSTSGKFVSAAAGPNFESLLGAMGSGIVDYTLDKGRQTILNVDIGGGTSNLAIVSGGEVLSTSCINVGGRLLGIDKDFKIWRIDEPTEFVFKELNLDYKIGDIISETDVRLIAKEYAKALIEVMRGPAKSKIAKYLMMTEDLDFSIPIDEYSFSGGVAEFIYVPENTYEPMNTYNDIGVYLAEEIQVFLGRHTVVQAVMLGQNAHRGAHLLGLFYHVITCHARPTRTRAQDGGQHAHGGSLAGSVRPQ